MDKTSNTIAGLLMIFSGLYLAFGNIKHAMLLIGGFVAITGLGHLLDTFKNTEK